MASITVQLPGSTEITEMDDSLLEKTEGGFDDDNEQTTWVEYRLNGDLVHRSAHVRLKHGILMEGSVGGVG